MVKDFNEEYYIIVFIEGGKLLMFFFFSAICGLRKAYSILQGYIHFEYMVDFLFT